VARSVAAGHDGGADLDIVNDAQGQHELRVLKGSQKAQPSVVAKADLG
jgi:hypothetical protein